MKKVMTHKKVLLALMLMINAFAFNLQAQTDFEFNGVRIPRTLKFQGRTLQFNGAGVREKMWTDLYVQTLYLSQLSQDAKHILDDDAEMAVRIQITSSLVSASKLNRVMGAGFEKSTNGKLDEIRGEMATLKSFLSDEIVRGDVFNLIYNPQDKSLHVFKNDVFKGKIQGFNFKKAFFGIWLGDNPVDQKLKESLLGKYK